MPENAITRIRISSFQMDTQLCNLSSHVALFLVLHIVIFVALIHPIQWTIANPVGADQPAKCQKKTAGGNTGRSLVLVHLPDGVLYILPV